MRSFFVTTSKNRKWRNPSFLENLLLHNRYSRCNLVQSVIVKPFERRFSSTYSCHSSFSACSFRWFSCSICSILSASACRAARLASLSLSRALSLEGA